MISLPTSKIFPDNKKQMLLAKALWICDFSQTPVVLDFFFSEGCQSHSTLTANNFPHLCRSISGFCWCLYLSRTPLPLWFHTFFRFTLGSCFPYSLLIPYSCGTSLELHHHSHLSLMLNREI